MNYTPPAPTLLPTSSFSNNNIYFQSTTTMVLMKLRDYLDVPDLVFTVRDDARPSVHQSNVDIESWDPWQDFNPVSIYTLFGALLEREFDFPAHPHPDHPTLLQISNERTLESAVTSWNVKIVNQAIQTVSEALAAETSLPTSQVRSPAFFLLWTTGSAARANENKTPDWAAVRSDEPDNFARKSGVTGDSKMYPPGFPLQRDSPATDVAQLCLEQVLDYATLHGTRYAVLLSPSELVLVRGALAPDDDGLDVATPLAARRAVRAQQQQPPQQDASSPLATWYAAQRTPVGTQRSYTATSSPPPANPYRVTAAAVAVEPRTPPSRQNHRRVASAPLASSSSPTAPSDSSYRLSSPTARRVRLADPQVAVVSFHAAPPPASPSPNGSGNLRVSVNVAMFVLHWLAGVKCGWVAGHEDMVDDPDHRRAMGLDG